MKGLILNKAKWLAAGVLFWALSPLPLLAQNLSNRPLPDSGVLVSGAKNTPAIVTSQTNSLKQSSNKVSQANMEPSMVDIQALGKASIETADGKIGLATPQSFGQGIILDPSGIIATNTHIIENAQHIYVYLAGGQKFEAQLLRSTDMDLSFIKINPPYPLRAMSLASNSQVQIGEQVTAYTNAGLNAQRKQSGQVTNVLYAPSIQMEMLEIQIPLNPGDSGGAVVDKQGSLVGLIMANLKSDHSKSFAIALSSIQQEYLKSKGSTVVN